MPPKNSNAAVERPFNLTENEINFTVHACKLLIQDGKVRSKVPYNMTYIYIYIHQGYANVFLLGKVDRFTLAEATGKGNPETAKRMW